MDERRKEIIKETLIAVGATESCSRCASRCFTVFKETKFDTSKKENS